MRLFLVGGTGFTGPAVVQDLLQRGHEVTVFHRGQTHDERAADAHHIMGDRTDGAALANAIAEFRPDVAVDMVPFTEQDAASFMRACRGVAPRVVALSSIDVYLAYGRIRRSELGPIQSTPLTETSALRETNQPDGPECDKIAVERIVMNDPDLPGTSLRLPAIYGRRDKYRRFRCYVKPMDAGRSAILLSEVKAGFKFSRGYVDDVARAIVLAIENESAAGNIYNVAERDTLQEYELVELIGKLAGWSGKIQIIPDADLPEHLRQPCNFKQDWEVDTTKIRQQLGYSEVVGREEGIRRTIAWDRECPPETEPYTYDYEAEDRALQQSQNNSSVA